MGNDTLKEDGLREGKVRRNKAILAKEPSKGNAEAVLTSPAGLGFPLLGHTFTDPFPHYFTTCLIITRYTIPEKPN